MNLHNSKQDFMAAIAATAKELNIPPAFVEKDYWVTQCLKNLSRDEVLSRWVVFKGGTALSKVYSLIKRFSEDIDLALLNGAISKDGIHQRPQKALNKVIKSIVPPEFKQKEQPKDSFPDRFKRVFDYPKNHAVVAGYPIHGAIVIETNAMGNPEPYNEVQIESYIAKSSRDLLTGDKFNEFVSHFKLEPFQIKVVPVEKTFCEKILAIRKAYHIAEDRGTQQFFLDRLRHLYDLFHINAHQDFSGILQSESFKLQMIKALEDDGPSKEIKIKLHESPLFLLPEETLKGQEVDSAWEGLKVMTFDDKVPTISEIVKMLKLVFIALEQAKI